MKRFYFILIFIQISFSVFSQQAYRINADILTKTRLIDSTFQVSKGKLYYDINYRKIIFNFTFPRKEQYVLFDTTIYVFEKNELQRTNFNYLIPGQSFFHFILSGNMANFGLNESNFKATNFKKEKDLVITTWEAPSHVKSILSKILIATKNKQLYSVTIFNGDEKVINRQILKNYQLIDGFEIPTEILVATYLSNGTMYQIINLSNVVLNQAGNDELYNKEL